MGVKNKSFQVAIKNLFWRLVPKKLGNKAVMLYYRTKKFKKPKWMDIQIYIVGKCNLNCVSCTAFAPIADDYMLDLASFESDCKRLSDLGGDKIREMTILGGEPLLHPQLTEILNIARTHFPNSKLKIVTNGTLLLKQSDEFWESCRSNNAYIALTPYPIKLDTEAIKNVAEKHGVALRTYPEQPWYKMAYDLSGSFDARKNYKKCRIGLQCPELRNGKIATCQVVLKAHYFNNYFKKDLEVTDNDVIDIYKAKSMDDILKFVASPVSFCRYCNIKGVPIKWGVSKKDISEWV